MSELGDLEEFDLSAAPEGSARRIRAGKRAFQRNFRSKMHSASKWRRQLKAEASADRRKDGGVFITPPNRKR